MSIDQVVSDFDGVTFHLSTPEAKTKILISISVKCFRELVRYGAEEVLQREYGPYITAPEAGYDFSVQVDLEDLPSEQGMWTLALQRHPSQLTLCVGRGPRGLNTTSVSYEAQCYGGTF